MDLVWLILCGLISIVVHELGHAWAARLCGFDVEAIHFGVGPPMTKFRRDRVDIFVGYPWTLFVGYVEVRIPGRTPILPRLFVYSAGLLVNAALMLVCSLGDTYVHQLTGLFAPLGILNLGIIVLNSIPFVVMRQGYTKMWTDGGRIAGLIQEAITGRNFTDR